MAIKVSTSELYSKSIDAKRIANNLDTVLTSVTQVKSSLSYDILGSVSPSLQGIIADISEQQKNMVRIENFLLQASQSYENSELLLMGLYGSTLDEADPKNYSYLNKFLSGMGSYGNGYSWVAAVGSIWVAWANDEAFLSSGNVINMGKGALTVLEKGITSNWKMKNLFSIDYTTSKKSFVEGFMDSTFPSIKKSGKDFFFAGADFGFDLASSYFDNVKEHGNLLDDYGRGAREMFAEAGIDYLLGKAVNHAIGYAVGSAATFVLGATPVGWAAVGTAALSVALTSGIMCAWDHFEVTEILSDGLNNFGEGAVKVATDLGKAAAKATGAVISTTADVLSTGAKAVYDVGKSAVVAGGELISTAGDAVVSMAETTASISKDVLNTLADVGETAVTGVVDVASSAVESASNMASSAVKAASTGASKVVSGVSSMWNKFSLF